MPVIDHHNILFCLFDSLSLENFDIHERDGALPSLSRLREGGVFFNHCYAPCPQSSPARASVFTGLDPAVHGVWTNGVELPATEKTFVQLLMGSGYSSYLAGRYQLAGVSRWTTEKILATDFDEIDWAHGPLHRSRQNAYLNWFKENAPEEYAKVFASQADPDSTSVSQQQIAAYSELPDELSFNHWIGECVKAKINSTASEKPLITVAGFSVGDAMGGEPRAGVDSELLSKDALIQADSAIGKIVELLQESGRLDDTVIVVASARGNSNPVDSKMQMGEGSIRVPLLFSQANFEKMTVEEPVSTVDIAPTVLNVSNVTYGPRMQGRPLPGACSSAEVPRNWAITRLRTVIDTVNREWCTSFCINNMKLLVRHGNRNDHNSVSLYNLDADPQEQNDLALNEANASVVEDMIDQMIDARCALEDRTEPRIAEF